MKNIPTAKIHKSPPKKLVRFFEKSRDQWKTKHHRVKATVKRLKNRVRFLEKSKAHWKSRVAELESEVARHQSRKQTLEQAVAALEKKETTNR